jgi:multicomponent Na+:H+ antiporter subunit G
VIEIVPDILSWGLILTGSAFAIVGAIGLIRLPDIYTRMHGASITDTLGAGLILSGLMVQSGFTLVTVKLILILIFLLYTSPASSYALANAAFTGGLRPRLHEKGDEPSESS